MKVWKTVALSTLIVFSNFAHAVSTGSASVYGGIRWVFSSPSSVLQGCSEMQMDASGDFANGSGFILYGAVNCPGLGGGYAASGPAYFDIDGNFNMTVTYANGAQIVCGRLNRQTLSGFCTVNNSTGAQVGSVTVNFR